MPSRDSPAEICDLRFTKLISGEVFVREDADASEMIQDCLKVKVGFMTAGKTLEVDVGEGAGGRVQVNDVADHEPVMPGAGLQPYWSRD